jgi:nicotinamide-nucleotide amidase
MISAAKAIIATASSQGVMIATAESCTGGMVAATLTDISGSSAVVDRGFITYSNLAKTQELGVSADLINAHGAVSKEVASAMAYGAAEAVGHPKAIAISVTGIAGPTGGTAEKPVGLVWFALARRQDDKTEINAHEKRFSGIRMEIRRAATDFALELIQAALKRD